MSQSASELHFQHRFWYESGDHPGAFSPGQLQEIRYQLAYCCAVQFFFISAQYFFVVWVVINLITYHWAPSAWRMTAPCLLLFLVVLTWLIALAQLKIKDAATM